MKQRCFFSVCWKVQGREFFLLWSSGKDRDDIYVTEGTEEKRLRLFNNDTELRSYAADNGLPLSEEPCAKVDFDGVSTLIRQMRHGKKLHTADASRLLDIWNALEDVGRSLGKTVLPEQMFAKRKVDRIYEKIFFGNNLPSLTPEEKSWHPYFYAEECRIIRTMFKSALRQIAEICRSPH